jgi:hypothetical protein
MIRMTDKEKAAYQWALNQDFTSVAATYAKTLAECIQRNQQMQRKADQDMSAALNSGDGTYRP